jgi:signal transduction histidine kinase
MTALDRRILEALFDSGLALIRAPDVARAWHEVAREARRATGYDGIAIALAAEETGQLALAFQSGFDEGDDHLAARLAPLWSAACADGRVQITDESGRTTVVAPMLGPDGAIGTLTLGRVRAADSRTRDTIEPVVHAIAAQLAAAVERGRDTRRAEHKRRIDTVGEVAAGVAQELRNPLFGISSAAQLLRFRTGEDPVVEKNVGRILREVERLNRMVTSLLEYGRPAPLTIAPVNPDGVWESVLDALRGRLESKAIVVDRLRAHPPATCDGDGDQLSQLFSNLLVNACDAAPHGGRVRVESDRTPAGAWRVRVHNGGAVIAPDVLPRVFDIFFSTKSGGTGIGLALCQRIVAEHHGTMALESSPERGTTVTVILPPAS